MENKYFLILSALLAIIGIISRNFVFLIFSAILLILFKPNLIVDIFKKINIKKNSENKDFIIEDGLLKYEDKFKAFLIVDDIPFDYRDLSNESLRAKIISFHKVLDVVDKVDILFQKKQIDKNKFLEDLFRRAQNLRVIIDADPSNEKAKNELALVQEMIKKISEGESPFQYIVYFIIPGNNKEEVMAKANLLKKGLESIGIKARLASKSEIAEYVNHGVIKVKEKTGFPTQIPYLTLFTLPKSPKPQLITDGVYLGKELSTSRPIFWNLKMSMNPHVLVIGPTGVGKTEFLIALGNKISVFYQIPVVFFDVKNDIKLRLKKYGIKPIVLSPLIYSLNLLSIDEGVNSAVYASQLESIIVNSFKLDKYSASVLYKAILDVLTKYEKPTWDKVIDTIISYDLSEELKIYLIKTINKIKAMDLEYKEQSLVDKIKDGVYVVDLSLIKSEELRRLVIYSILIKILNKFNIADDKLKISLVIDEAWTILKQENENYSIVADIVKRGRGYGIMLMMATQNIYDLGEMADIFLENMGLLIFMNNGDKKFWQEMQRFANINDEEIQRELSFLGRGEAVIRFIGDPRPLVVKLDTLVD